MDARKLVRPETSPFLFPGLAPLRPGEERSGQLDIENLALLYNLLHQAIGFMRMAMFEAEIAPDIREGLDAISGAISFLIVDLVPYWIERTARTEGRDSEDEPGRQDSP